MKFKQLERKWPEYIVRMIGSGRGFLAVSVRRETKNIGGKEIEVAHASFFARTLAELDLFLKGEEAAK